MHLAALPTEIVSSQGQLWLVPWIQLTQAGIALLNLCVIVYVFLRTRRDKKREERLAVDSFWLQKVIVEPNAKEIDELHAALESDLVKAQAEAKRLHENGLGRSEDAIASYADTASRRLEKFRFRVLPLFRIVVDRGLPVTDPKPSQSVDEVIDNMDDALTTAIARLFDDPAANADIAHEALRDGRFRLLQVLFLLHKHPFDRKDA